MTKLVCIPFLASFLCGASWFFAASPAATCDFNTVPNLALNFDPRIVTKNGSNQVTVWQDQSSNHNDATQSAGSTAFVYTAGVFGGGTLPALRATAANSQFMTLTNHITSMSEFSSFVVIKAASGSEMYMLSGSTGSGGAVFRINNGTVRVSPWDGGSNFFFAEGTQTVAGTNYLFQIQSTSAPATAIVKQNGVTLTHSSNAGSSWNMDVQYIDQRNGGSSFADGDLGPVILYSRSITDLEATYVVNCLQTQGWYP